jgi:lactate dehydrogenase-like 2-hydroxyacid dehydrogenase
MPTSLLSSAQSSCVVVVTELEYRKAERVFRAATQDGLRCVAAPAVEPELAAAVRASGARHAIVGVDAYRGLLYDALPAGGVIARFGIGHDGINKVLATARGLYCTNTPGVLDDSVAEHAIGLMLAAVRHTVTVAGALVAGRWQGRVGGELRGKTLAVIGCGPIGCRTAAIASRGLGMRVIGCKRTSDGAERLRQDFGFAGITCDFAAAVREADLVSLNLPSVPETRHYLNQARLALLPAHGWVVNTARGAVVDEVALFDALAAGRLAGAALDVFACEPYEPVAANKDLRTLPNVVLTPHVGSSTSEACERMAVRALRNLRLAIAGRPAEMDLLNREVLAVQPAAAAISP